MKNMKVSLRLIVSFMVVMTFAVAVGLVGITGMKSINRDNDVLYNHNLLAVSAMGNICENIQAQRVVLRNFIIFSGDEAKSSEAVDSLRDLENSMTELFAQYEATITDEAEETVYYGAKNLYLNDFAVIKENARKANEISFEASMERLADPNVAPTTTAIIDGFTTAMENNKTQAAKKVAENTAQYRDRALIEFGALAVAIIASFVLALYISGTISKPITTMGNFFVRFGSMGDLSLSEEDRKNIEAKSRDRDEIGQCINAAAKMVGRLTDINDQLTKVAECDLTASIAVLSEKDSLGLSFRNMIGNLNDMFHSVQSASSQVSAGAQQISQGAQGLASGSSQQAASIEEFSTSLAELDEKTHRNAEKTVTARKLSNEAGAMIEDSIHSMGEMLGAMKEIDESSKSITKVIKVIDDIAFQTNILALNAAVEAARAGQHGKGFAVVADEVRNLASKSAAAAKETAALIEGSSEKVREGNLIVEKTNASLDAVVTSAKEASVLLEEVAVDSTEQAKAITDMNQSIGQISNVVQENSASAEESAAASEEMSAQAVMLNGIVSRLKLKASGNISDVHGTNDGLLSDLKDDEKKRSEKY